MAELLLFHHVLGQTAGFLAFAQQLRDAGHVVHTPDLFEGRTFDSIEAGAAHVQQSGFADFIERGVAAADGLPNELVYAGVSLGVMPAQKLAQTRSGAQGALLFEACAPPSEFGGEWPTGLPVQIHGMDADPFFAGEGDIDAARALVEHAAATGTAELFLYSGDRHLFTDSSIASYDPEAATLVLHRARTFLDEISMAP